jgi:hypothetical protein
MKLMQNIDKERVKAVIQSLKNFNNQILQQNGINEVVDDTLYLNIKFNKNIEILNEKTRIGSIGGQSLVQVKLPSEIKKSNILLLVKEGETRKFEEVVEDANIGIKKICTIKEF